ncbi:hypothetical protein FDP41_010284 [Naegleria fowleri]|uniref:Uncharacterized protein n=1 Tax=Naegleria fowleri TaxID=5763 RepID=A0A6A5CD38_NAEFO|nr:uncharacterized protein FDP41_010284 [Naegleria fowleri]KAF0983219.1 hypothetical protein FDP41_010284 [Naegleria fowleri]CAG4718281.1 unnamed protein product [Naegleria fowleri]
MVQRFTKLRDEVEVEEEDPSSLKETTNPAGSIGTSANNNNNNESSLSLEVNSSTPFILHPSTFRTTELAATTTTTTTNEKNNPMQTMPSVANERHPEMNILASTLSSPSALSDSLLSVSNPNVQTLHRHHHFHNNTHEFHHKNPHYSKVSNLKVVVSPPTNQVQARLLHDFPNGGEQQFLHNTYHMERNDELSCTNEGYVKCHNSVNIHNNIDEYHLGEVNLREKGKIVLGGNRPQHYNNLDDLKEESFHMGDEEQDYDLVTDKSLDKIESVNSLNTAGSEEEIKKLTSNQKSALYATNVKIEQKTPSPRKMIRTKSNVTECSTSSQSSAMDPIDSSRKSAVPTGMCKNHTDVKGIDKCTFCNENICQECKVDPKEIPSLVKILYHRNMSNVVCHQCHEEHLKEINIIWLIVGGIFLGIVFPPLLIAAPLICILRTRNRKLKKVGWILFWTISFAVFALILIACISVIILKHVHVF